MRWLTLVLFAVAAFAQNGSQFRDWTRLADEPRSGARVRCDDLRALTGYAYAVSGATMVPAAGEVPEHCRVRGQILPEVGFEVSLPSAWNRRLYMFGNGGYAGEAFDAPQRAVHRGRALLHGFAVAQTDTGHSAAIEPLGSFAVNRQKLLDYAFRSLHVTAETAKTLIAAYYGAGPERSYFDGCSTGGRQGLILAQRFPNDFDGIVAGAPVLDFTGTMVSYAWIAQSLAAAPIPYAKLSVLAERVYAVCDEKDGLKDGLIDDPLRCAFTPARDLPKCADDKDAEGCFTTAQIRTLGRIYADVTSQGAKVFPGWPPGAEIAGPNGRSGWENWLISGSGPTISVRFAETFFRYMAFPEKDPKYELPRFDFTRDPPRLAAIREILDATDPDLEAFRRRGGKLLMYYGWADPALNARMATEYYERAYKRSGDATAGFFRLFMVPGMFHCAGGVGTSTFDAVTPLIRWVEKAEAPDRIVAARVVKGATVRSRPLCPYPMVARYKGEGSVDEAESFACAALGP